ncbi:RIKEN cDNA 1700092C17 [Mus musculus]|nr:RIKEN cDNA 1700092C17 [Mus musculus]
MGFLPSAIKEPQIRSLKILLVIRGLKVKTHDLDQFLEETAILAPWISPENMWDPDLWMCVLFLA